MKAAIYRGIGKINMEDVPMPKGENGKLFKVLYVGICGTDVKTFKRGHPLFVPPCVLGHEFVAEYNGKIYAVAPYIECGRCGICKKGLGELCKNKSWVNGALTEFVFVPEEIVERGTVEIPKELDPRVFTLTEPLACVLHGIQRARISKGMDVLIVGAGFMGLLFAITLKKMGCNILISEIDNYREERAKEYGFRVINPQNEDLSKREGAFDSIILANDRAELVEELLPLTGPGGTFLLFGGMPKDAKISVSPYLVHYKEVDIVGSFGFASSDFKKAFTLIKDAVSEYFSLITKEFPLDKVGKAFLEAQDKRNLKVLVKISP